MIDSRMKRDSSPATRHARRIYVGGWPPGTTEAEVMIFFNDICNRGLKPSLLPNDGGLPVISVYLNTEKWFAFVEFPSFEIATAVIKLDGIQYRHRGGICTLKMKRPHDYKPELVPQSTLIVDFSLPEFHIVSTNCDGPEKLFVGGLPYQLGAEEVKELLSAFGPLKAFNLVRDPGAQISKGYCFCEYFDSKTTQIAIEGLNGFPIGDKHLTARLAETRGSAAGTDIGGIAQFSALTSAPTRVRSILDIPCF